MSMPIIVPGKTTRCQAISDIIESVALEQTALSHILNAEGEKIQAFLAMPGVSPSTLLAANKSVKTIVESITRLEMVLQSKLSLFADAIGPCLPGVTEVQSTSAPIEDEYSHMAVEAAMPQDEDTSL